GRRGAVRALRPGAGPARRGARRRPQRLRAGPQRRRPGDRPAADGRRHRRPRGRGGARRRRGHDEPAGPRHPAPRPRHHRRPRLHHRRRRLRAGRRLRLAGPLLRPGRGQPARGGTRHRRREQGPRECRREPGAVLGTARGRRQLRHRHRAHPEAARTAGVLPRPADVRPEFGRDAVRTFRDVVEPGPVEASGGVVHHIAPPEEFVPPHLVGDLVCTVVLTYAGGEADLRKLAQPLLALPHEAEIVGTLPYAEFQCMLDDPPGLRNYWSAEYLTGLPDELVDVYCARAASLPARTGTQHTLFPQGGAIADGPADYPVPFRDAPWAVHPFGVWEDPADDERCVRWVRDVRADVRPWSTGA